MNDDRLTRLEAELQRLTDEVRALERRLAALETRTSAPGAARAAEETHMPPVMTAEPASQPTRLAPADAADAVALAGRTFLVLAGAFLLRALTDAGLLGRWAGVLAGLAYATIWLVLAVRASARGRRTSADVHGLAFTLIALPIVFEATVRFRLWSAATSAAALAGIVAGAFLVAWPYRLRGLAWVAALGSVLVAVALMAATAELAPYTCVLIGLGVATLWAGYVLDWVGLRWPVAAVTDLTVLLLSARSVTRGSLDGPADALVVQLLLLGLYLGSFATRTLLLNRDVIPFEVVQSAAALAVGLGGAAYVTRTTGVGAAALGFASLALGVGCYLVALVFIERRQRRRKNFHFYTAAAFIFVVTGTSLVLASGPRALVWSGLALVAAVGGRTLDSLTLKAHALLYTLAAAGAGGWLAHAVHGLGAPQGLPWLPATAGDLAGVAAAVATTVVVIGAAPARFPTPFSRVPGVILLALSLGGVIGVGVAAVTPWLGAPGPKAAGTLATIRTAALVGATLLMAWLGRSPRLPEAGWLVPPLLVVSGVKIVLEDLRVSRPATLFVAFALYGVALSLAPRLRRRI